MNRKKIDWDTYYLTLAFAAARRSIDPSTRHGCVIVSNDNRILSVGYNGPIQHSDDDKISLERPDKYYSFLHAEENALLSYCGSKQDIINAKTYITGKSCHKCLRMLIQKGIMEIIYCDVKTTSSVMLDLDELKAIDVVLSCRPDFSIRSVSNNLIVDNINSILSHASGESRI